MPNIAFSLTQNLVRGLGAEPATQGGVRAWMENAGYVPRLGANDEAIELFSSDLPQLVPFLSFDYERFALASAESLLVATSEWTSHGSMGWPLLKLYYSAFFAAHAVMRSQGTGIVKVERQQAKMVNDFLKVLDPTSTIMQPGMFLYTLDGLDNGEFRLRFTKHGNGGGVHEGFWDSFCRYLGSAAERAVETGALDADDFLMDATEVTSSIRGSGSGANSWLSSTRNEINYQHKHSVWFPTARSQRNMANLGSLRIVPSNTVSLPTSTRKAPIAAFSQVSLYLGLLNIDIADYVAARSTRGGAFGQKWRRLQQQLGRA